MKEKPLTLEEIIKRIPNPPKLSPTLNRYIDDLKLPPLADSALHLMAEQLDTAVFSITKSIRYHLPDVLKKVKKK